MLGRGARTEARVTGLRERKKKQTRAAILAAAERQFLAHGYEAVGMEGVAAEAEVSLATLYNYFPTKADLAFQAMVATGRAAVAEQEAEVLAATPDAEAAVAITVARFVALVRRFDRTLLRQLVMLSAAPSPEYGGAYSDMNRAFAEQLDRVLAACQADGRLPAALDRAMLRRVLFSVVESEFVAWVRNDAATADALKQAIEEQVGWVLGLVGARR